MANGPKTRLTAMSVDDFIDAQGKESVRDDCRVIIRLMGGATHEPPKMWGPSIVGFGSAPITYANGKQLDWPVCAFSPRKTNLTLYLNDRYKQREDLLAKLGKHSTSKGCLYIKRLSDVDQAVLEQVIEASVTEEGKE